MDQGKSQTKSDETAIAGATRTEEVIIGGADSGSAALAERSAAAGEDISPARGKRGGTARDERADAARPKQAGKGKGRGKGEAGTGTGLDHGKVRSPKNKAQADRAAASKAKSSVDAGPFTAAPAQSKLDKLVALLRAASGATLPELQVATGWQVHSVRGAMAGALRKKGYSVISEKPEGALRRYRIAEAS
jgi:hypothetical protein